MNTKDVIQVALAIAAIFIGIDLSKYVLAKMVTKTTTPTS